MKTWSISTSIRNPERIPDFMRAIALMEGRRWDTKAQTDYYIHQIALRIRSKIRRTKLSRESIAALDGPTETLSFDQAKRIYIENEYVGEGMRGRQDIKVLANFGLVDKSESVKITSLGRAFLNNQIELSELMLNFDFKWQVPEPEHSLYTVENGYGIRPFIGTLALIKRVNDLWEAEGNKPVGLTWVEFCSFVPTLIHHSKINTWAERVIENRKKALGLSAREKERKEALLIDLFLQENMDSSDTLEGMKKTLKDYGDNAFRYFKQSRMLKLRGGGFHVDISEVSSVQVNMLIEAEEYKPLSFNNSEEYRKYMEDLTSFSPPWVNPENARRVRGELTKMLEERGITPTNPPKFKATTQIPSLLKEDEEISLLRQTLTESNLQNLTNKAVGYEFLLNCALDYEKLRRKKDIAEAEEKKLKRPAQLEYLSFKAFLSINDLVRIQPNYPTDDEGNPLFTAGSSVADLEVFYEDFNLICEVTMLSDRSQWVAEGQPVQRHLFEFSKKYPDKEAFAVFLAPVVHPDTKNTFRQAFYGGYGSVESLKIVPFDFNTWIEIIRQLSKARATGKNLNQKGLLMFLESCLPSKSKIEKTDDWWNRIVNPSNVMEYL